jgi:hypothetical protein
MLVDELDPANPESGQVVIGTVAPTYEALNPELQTFRIHRRLTLAANPFLREHVMSEHPFCQSLVSCHGLLTLVNNFIRATNFLVAPTSRS